MNEIVQTILNALDSLEDRLEAAHFAIKREDLNEASNELRAASYEIHDLLHELRKRKAA